MNVKQNNHLYPAFHIRKWMNNGGKIFDKSNNSLKVWEPKYDFTARYYYSMGRKEEELEDRISSFEAYICKIIKRIDEADGSITLSAKDLEILKLYCYLTTCRHEFTTEVINSDESGIYKSNNYLFGAPNIKTQGEAVNKTSGVMDEFEKLLKLDDSYEVDVSESGFRFLTSSNFYTWGTHIAIGRALDNYICISDRFSIIENTMDSDHLYTYIPISPKTTLFLVKSKYYHSPEIFKHTKERFGRKYGFGRPDEFLSSILGGDRKNDWEKNLFCSYRHTPCNYLAEPKYIDNKMVSKVVIKINELPKPIIDQYNEIYYEDGRLILYCNDDAFRIAKENKCEYRKIVITPYL